MFAEASDADQAGHGGGNVMQDGAFQLVVQLLTLIHPGVHGGVQEEDEGEDDDKGDGKVGIKETNDDDLNM